MARTEPNPAPIRDLAPVALTIHPILDGHPQWADDDPQFESFCRDISEYGIDHPICIDAKNRIIDGRQRWRAAKRLKLETVACQTVPEDGIPRLILHYILQRRHYSKGALCYMSLPLIAELYVAGSISVESVVVQEFGFSFALYKQAQRLAHIFREGDLGAKYKEECEPGILSGDLGLGAAIAGWAGMQATLGQKKNIRSALDLWDRSFTDLQRRFTTWDKFDPETKASVAAKLVPLVESMPDDLLHRFQSKLSAELKTRKDA